MSNPTFTTSSLSQRTKVTAVIREARPMKVIRNAVLALTLTLTGATSMTQPSVAQAQAVSPTTTAVMVILTVKAGVTREQVMAVMPGEIRQTVQLYLNGKIREWYSRGDGRGVVFLLDSRSPRRRRSWMAYRWPGKILWTTNTSQSVRFCRSACSWPIRERTDAPVEACS
jgi:hypothetical protein